MDAIKGLFIPSEILQDKKLTPLQKMIKALEDYAQKRGIKLTNRDLAKTLGVNYDNLIYAKYKTLAKSPNNIGKIAKPTLAKSPNTDTPHTPLQNNKKDKKEKKDEKKLFHQKENIKRKIDDLLIQDSKTITELQQPCNPELYQAQVAQNLSKEFEQGGKFEQFCHSNEQMFYKTKASVETLKHALSDIYQGKVTDKYGRAYIASTTTKNIDWEMNNNPNWRWLESENIYLIIEQNITDSARVRTIINSRSQHGKKTILTSR